MSDAPVMIFQEGLDTQTPVSFGKAALETLENGFFLEWPSEGHVIATVLVLAAGLAAAPAAAQTEEVVPRLRPLDFAPFEAGIEGLDPELIAALDRILPTLSVPGLQALMAAGELSSETLTLYLLHRAASYDETFRIFIELNPQALDAARAADALFAEGTVLVPMQGIPVTLKDNIGTAGPIYTTAGPRS